MCMTTMLQTEACMKCGQIPQQLCMSVNTPHCLTWASLGALTARACLTPERRRTFWSSFLALVTAQMATYLSDARDPLKPDVMAHVQISDWKAIALYITFVSPRDMCVSLHKGLQGCNKPACPRLERTWAMG